MNGFARLLRAAYGRGNLALDQAERLYMYMLMVVFAALGIVVLGMLANLAGSGWVCIPVAMVFATATAVTWFRPTHVALVTLTGVVARGLLSPSATTRDNALWVLKIYVDLLGKVLLYGTIILLVLGVVPFAGHAAIAFALIPGAALFALMSWQWKIPAKRLLGSIVMIGWLAAIVVRGHLLMPDAWWGHSPSFWYLGRWSWDRWLPLLMLSGALIFAIGYFWGDAARKSAMPIVLGILALFLLVPYVVNAPLVRGIGYELLGTPEYVSATPSEMQLPVATSDTNQWAQVAMAPDGKSMLFQETRLTRLRFAGHGFTVMCIWSSKEAQPSPFANRCPHNHVGLLYLRNNTDRENYPGYAFAE